MIPETSIVMASYNRAHLLRPTLQSIFDRNKEAGYEIIVVEDGYDGGATYRTCASFPGIRYHCRRDRPSIAWSNPAVPLNIGIRMARGKVVIIQNPECIHVTGGLVEKLTAAVLADPMGVVFSNCRAYQEGIELGHEQGWVSYCDNEARKRPLFFCGGILKEHLVKIRGFDEDYKYYGSEDGDLADRLLAFGLHFTWRDDLRVYHQFHPSAWNIPGTNKENAETKENRALYAAKTAAFTVERNLGREWGSQ